MKRLLLVCALAVLAACAAPAPAAGPAGGAPSGGAAVATPAQVTIPAIGVDSDLTGTGMRPGGIPEVPPVTEPWQASWATWSPRPGETGPAVLYGHVDGVVHGRRGTLGVFARLDDLRPGQPITVDRGDGSRVTFAVTRVASWPKSEFDDPASAVVREVYGDVPDPQLRLVTCGGAFDQAERSYRDQVVVFAALVGPGRAP